MAAKTIFYFVGILLFVDLQAQVTIVYDVFPNFKINITGLIKITGINYFIQFKCLAEQCFQLFFKCCAKVHNENNFSNGFFYVHVWRNYKDDDELLIPQISRRIYT